MTAAQVSEAGGRDFAALVKDAMLRSSQAAQTIGARAPYPCGVRDGT